MKLFEFIIDLIQWVKIVLSPTGIGLVIASLIYFSFPSFYTLVIAIIISALGLIIGIIWATKIWKKEGTHSFMSKIYASPDLDKKYADQTPKEDNAEKDIRLKDVKMQ